MDCILTGSASGLAKSVSNSQFVRNLEYGARLGDYISRTWSGCGNVYGISWTQQYGDYTMLDCPASIHHQSGNSIESRKCKSLELISYRYCSLRMSATLSLRSRIINDLRALVFSII